MVWESVDVSVPLLAGVARVRCCEGVVRVRGG